MRTELKVLGYGSVVLFSIAGLIGALDGATLKVNGTEYVSLRTVAERLGMKRQWVVKGKQMILRSDWTRMEFRVNDRDIRINGIRVYLGSPVAFRQGDLNISKLDLEYTVSRRRLRRVVVTERPDGRSNRLQPLVALSVTSATVDISSPH